MSEVKILQLCDEYESLQKDFKRDTPYVVDEVIEKLIREVRKYLRTSVPSMENTPEPAEDDVCSEYVDKHAMDIWIAYMYGMTDAVDSMRKFIDPDLP